MADGNHRFEQTIDMRGPLMLMVNKACSAVMDDLPKGFELKDSLQASTPAILPNKVLREAIVNAFIHRSNRVNQPIQIIRYSNRIEIHNPGYSLKSPELWGEPGSELRNPRISEIFHDTNLAETKGTGMGAMRRLMKEAGLMPPTFESNHEANKFTARLLLHHFLSKENMAWLSMFAEYNLINEQKLALVFVREVGAIDNATYRQLDMTITHARARLEINKLCELGFLLKKGQGRNTYYIKTEKVVSLGEMFHGKDEKSVEMFYGKQEMFHGEEKIYHALSRDSLIAELPEELKGKILGMKKWTAKEDMNQLIISLCSLRPYSIEELEVILKRDPKSLKGHKIKTLLESKQLFYWIPEMIRHPQQKYVADPSMARSKTKK